MDAQKFKEECESANEKLSQIPLDGEPKESLRRINENLKIVKVTHICKRARFFVGAGVALAAAAGLVTGAVFVDDIVMRVAFIIAAAALAFGGVWWAVSHISAVAHKAVCVTEGGKVKEFIFSKNGMFIYNTIESETYLTSGEVHTKKHEFTKYRPMYPYIDFLDRDYSNYLKARTGHGYDGGETYERDASHSALKAYNGKKHKFTLTVEDGIPVKMDYLYGERFVYSRVNDSAQTVYIPAVMRGKIRVPEELNVEYVGSDVKFKELWKKI